MVLTKGISFGHSRRKKIDHQAVKANNIIFPSLKLLLSLDISRKISGYIAVKTTSKESDVIDVDKTETILDNDKPKFSALIEVRYDIGVDDHQKVIFEIYDDDRLKIHGGYLFARIEVFMTDLLRAPNLPLIRDGDLLGYLKVECDVLINFEEVTLNDCPPFFEESRPSKRDVKARYYNLEENLKMYSISFEADPFSDFETTPPDLKGGTVFLEMLLFGPKKSDNEVITAITAAAPGGDGSSTRLHLSRSMKEYPIRFKDDAPIEVSNYELYGGPTKLDLYLNTRISGDHQHKIIFNVYFKSKDGDIKLGCSRTFMISDLLRGLDEEKKKAEDMKSTKTSVGFKIESREKQQPKYTNLMGPFEIKFPLFIPMNNVAINGLKKLNSSQTSSSSMNFNLKLVSNASPTSDSKESISASNGTRGGGILGFMSSRNSKKTAEIVMAGPSFFQLSGKKDEDMDEDIKDIISSLGKSKPKNSNAVAMNREDRIEKARKVTKEMMQLDEELEGRTGGYIRVTLSEMDTISKLKQKSGKSRKESVAAGGAIEKEKKKTALFHEGDRVHDAIIETALQQDKDDWKFHMKTPFDEACRAQEDLTRKSCVVFKAIALEGWSLDPQILVDFSGATAESLEASMQPQKNETPNISLGSTLTDLFLYCSHLSTGRRVVAYAGGGVGPPSGSHPSAYNCRYIGFPLVQEYLLNAKRRNTTSMLTRFIEFTNCNSSPDYYIDEEDLAHTHEHQNRLNIPNIDMAIIKIPKSDELDPGKILRNFLEKSDLNSWGGSDYVRNAEYRDLTDFRQGFLEAASLYCPPKSYMNKIDAKLASTESSSGSRVTEETTAGNGKFNKNAAKKRNSSDSDKNPNLSLQRPRSLSRKLHRWQHPNNDTEALAHLIDTFQDPKQVRLVVWVLGKYPHHSNTIASQLSVIMDDMARRETGRVGLLIIADASYSEIENFNRGGGSGAQGSRNRHLHFSKFLDLFAECPKIEDEVTKVMQRKKLGQSKVVAGSDGPDPCLIWSHQTVRRLNDRDKTIYDCVEIARRPRLSVLHNVTWEELLDEAYAMDAASGVEHLSSGSGAVDSESDLPTINAFILTLTQHLPPRYVRKVMRVCHPDHLSENERDSPVNSGQLKAIKETYEHIKELWMRRRIRSFITDLMFDCVRDLFRMRRLDKIQQVDTGSRTVEDVGYGLSFVDGETGLFARRNFGPEERLCSCTCKPEAGVADSHEDGGSGQYTYEEFLSHVDANELKESHLQHMNDSMETYVYNAELRKVGTEVIAYATKQILIGEEIFGRFGGKNRKEPLGKDVLEARMAVNPNMVAKTGSEGGCCIA